jgi:sigma-B regulation protein RsbU (phosphoserine phosphatase)
VELVGRHAGGNPVIMEVAFTDMDLQGQRWHIAFARDITARRLAENALQLAEQEFELARDIQRHLFPKAAPVVEGFDIAGATSAAVEAGGDYYDFLPMPEGDLGLIVSDVSGHGVGPALIMAETRAYLRLAAKNRRDAGLVLTRANEVLAQDLEDSGRFVTALLARLDPAARRLSYANAGHTAGYVLDACGEIKQTLNRRRPPLGLTAATSYAENEPIDLESGDLVLLLTDGVEEAEALDGSVFGAERALAAVREVRHRSAAEVIETLRAALLAFAQGQAQKDDLTVIVAKVG